MFAPSPSVLNVVLDWLQNGFSNMSWWQTVLYTLVTTHITIITVTIFLHRTQTHRAMVLGPVPSHFFRFWLWLGTGMVTKEWVAIHRKHHAKCETEEDPHSPQVKGIEQVLWRGAELYRSESKNKGTLQRYGHGTPDDWLERNVYERYSWQGVGLMLMINLALFGVLGLTVWASQMLWIPITAAGIVNGVGHYWGYRNFEAPDASRNVWPWGLMIGGEELHNNHHTYPTSAKFSVKTYEFDVGWVYISVLQKIGWAKVNKLPPKLQIGVIQPVADATTLEAVIANRYEIMAGFARALRHATRDEITQLKAEGADPSILKAAKRWGHRDEDKVPAAERHNLVEARAAHPVLDKMVTMREELRQLWLNTSRSREQLIADLATWCHRAESSGIASLLEFSKMVRPARLAQAKAPETPTPPI